VWARIEVERRGRAFASHFDVLRSGSADRHAGVRKVRQCHQQPGSLLFDVIHLDLELTDLLRARLVGGKNGGRVQALALGARNFVTRRVLLALEPFEFRDQPAPVRLQRRELLELGVRLQAAVSQAGADIFHVFANIRRIEHP
jgi:hypothetical protein